MGIGTGNINDIVEVPSFDGLEFACAADRGVFIIYVLKGRLVQKVSEEILKETGVKFIQNYSEHCLLLCPKWRKLITRYARTGETVFKPANSAYTYKDLEWTNSLSPLDFGANPRKEDWRIGTAGGNLILSELISEHSYVLLEGVEFNLFTRPVIARHFDNHRKLFIVLFVVYDDMEFKDILYRAEINFAFLQRAKLKMTNARLI